MELTMFGLWNINDLVECWRVRCIFLSACQCGSLHSWIIVIYVDLLRHFHFDSHQISFELFWPTQNNILPFHQSINSYPAGSVEGSIAAGSRRKDQTLKKKHQIWQSLRWHAFILTRWRWYYGDNGTFVLTALSGLRVIGRSCSTRQQHWAMGLGGAGY